MHNTFRKERSDEKLHATLTEENCRRTRMNDLFNYGYNGISEKLPEGQIPGRIVEVRREIYKVVCSHGEVTASLRGAFFHRTEERGNYPAVGDFVLMKHNGSGPSSIVDLLPRTSKFSRTDFSGHAAAYVKTVLEQVVAANFDYVFIVSSLNRDFNAGRIARYLTQARQSGGVPVVILTKADLCEDAATHIAAVREIAPDIDVIALSSHTGVGLGELNQYVRPGKTIVFLGMSGVGKSSLLNALAGENLMDVKEIREEDSRGRHTTTHRQLVRLPSGAMIIDTPGMRELGLWDAGEGIDAAFADIEAIIARCRFSDCRHQTESGCAVKAALADKTLPEKHWKSYLAQKNEADFVSRRTRRRG